MGDEVQLVLALTAARPALKPREPIHPWVLKMIDDGLLNFLDRTALKPGQKESKVAKKKPMDRPKWLPKRG